MPEHPPADLESGEAPAVRVAPPAEVAPQWGVGRLARHVLMCAGPDCCQADTGDRVWRYLKRRLSEMGLVGNRPTGPAVYRTRCKCLRMCSGGPIVVVYPEGAWYQKVDEQAAERILQEHVVGGRVVSELCFALNPLAGGELSPASRVGSGPSPTAATRETDQCERMVFEQEQPK